MFIENKLKKFIINLWLQIKNIFIFLILNISQVAIFYKSKNSYNFKATLLNNRRIF